MILIAAMLGASVTLAAAADDQITLDQISLKYAPAPLDNPLKGLVPYASHGSDPFPHSMEYESLPLAPIQTGLNTFDWQSIDTLLNDVASRGHQVIIRVYLEFPGRPSGVPAFLIRGGLHISHYQIEGTSGDVESPDYSDSTLIEAFKNFIAAFGKRYDGDPRLGFVEAGLLGAWGEWHTWPKPELFASKAVQSTVMDSYAAAFRKTIVLLRHPAGPDDPVYSMNDQSSFGYHDDSFAWTTLADAKEPWHFMNLMETAGALDRWQHVPIGGEIRPEAWGAVFDTKPADPHIESITRCIADTHASWLLDSGMFSQQQSNDRVVNARRAIQQMGYELFISNVAATTDEQQHHLHADIAITNRGVAPFYYDWPIECALLDDQRSIVVRSPIDASLRDVFPNAKPTEWKADLNLSTLKPGKFKLLIGIPNPLTNGKPLAFANQTQNADLPGWCTLAAISIP